MMIKQALIMAAGQAQRMRPLTDNTPKPLLAVGGTPLLTHIIDHLVYVGVDKIIINAWHAIEALKAYMKTIQSTYPEIEFILSEETELLETGGGAVQALQYLDRDAPFYMINGDAYWMNAPYQNTLETLAVKQAETKADLILLLQPIDSMTLTGAVGDYDLNGHKATRALDKNGNHMFTGVRIAHPRILSGYKAEHFSFLTIMDAMDAECSLYGMAHEGEWYHISTPADLDSVNACLLGKAS